MHMPGMTVLGGVLPFRQHVYRQSPEVEEQMHLKDISFVELLLDGCKPQGQGPGSKIERRALPHRHPVDGDIGILAILERKAHKLDRARMLKFPAQQSDVMAGEIVQRNKDEGILPRMDCPGPGMHSPHPIHFGHMILKIIMMVLIFVVMIGLSFVGRSKCSIACRQCNRQGQVV